MFDLFEVRRPWLLEEVRMFDPFGVRGQRDTWAAIQMFDPFGVKQVVTESQYVHS